MIKIEWEITFESPSTYTYITAYFPKSYKTKFEWFLLFFNFTIKISLSILLSLVIFHLKYRCVLIKNRVYISSGEKYLRIISAFYPELRYFWEVGKVSYKICVSVCLSVSLSFNLCHFL